VVCETDLGLQMIRGILKVNFLYSVDFNYIFARGFANIIGVERNSQIPHAKSDP
jgi:hypothetical protein